MSSYSQTPTQIDSLGYKFSINLPEGSEYIFNELSVTDESGVTTISNILQLSLMLKDKSVMGSILPEQKWDIEAEKSGWLTDSVFSIQAETDHSFLIKGNEFGTTQYHLIFYKSLITGSYIARVYYQDMTLQEAESVIQILESISE
jgi:hypothetical protein